MGLCIKAVVFLARSFVENYHNVGGARHSVRAVERLRGANICSHPAAGRGLSALPSYFNCAASSSPSAAASAI